MKKTLTVNLNNTVFNIDDDAYDMLHNYLLEIANHFQEENERKEIMNDVEARIAELLTEKLQKNKNVVNLTDVDEIIAIMGNPSQYTDEHEEEPLNEKKTKKSRRFYRDPENAILGGIGGGIAAYFGWDVTLVRVVLILLVFLGIGSIIPIYIVVWFVAPVAVTASQRLEMQGEDVTVESIKTEMNNVKNYMESEKFKQSASTVGEKVFEVLRWVLKIGFVFIGVVLGIVGVVLIGTLLLVLFMAIFEPTVINNFAPGFIPNFSQIAPDKIVLLIISLILIAGCPIFLLIYWAVKIISGRQHNGITSTIVILILWIAGIIMLYSNSNGTLLNFDKMNGPAFSIGWSDDDTVYTDENRVLDKFNGIDLSGNIELVLRQGTEQKVLVSNPDIDNSDIITKVEGGILHIYTKKQFFNKTVKVHISVDSIQRLNATGACKIVADSLFQFRILHIDLFGASRADLNLNVKDSIVLNLEGASKIDMKGTSTYMGINGEGASKINAEELYAKSINVRLVGACKARINASETLSAEAIGASRIDCSGTPKKVTKIKSGASHIEVE